MERPSPSVKRRISWRRASNSSRSISSRRSWLASSATIPPTTSLDRLVPPSATRRIERTISSAPVPFTRYPTAPARSISRTVGRSSNAESAITRVSGEMRWILPRGACPASGGHLHVDERHVRALARGQVDGLVGVGGGPDEEDMVFLREEVGEGAAQRGFVVGDEDADARARTVPRCRGAEGDHEPRR